MVWWPEYALSLLSPCALPTGSITLPSPYSSTLPLDTARSPLRVENLSTTANQAPQDYSDTPCPFQRDQLMALSGNHGGVSYVGSSSLKPFTFQPEARGTGPKWLRGNFREHEK
jgi:hypothetical protein